MAARSPAQFQYRHGPPVQELLLYLGKKLGIAPEEMMVFGDSGNDLDMIKMAGIGVAMANAEPEVLKAADFVTKSNNENGVGGFLVSADY